MGALPSMSVVQGRRHQVEQSRFASRYSGGVAKAPKPDLDERFSLHPEDPEDVLRTLLHKKKDEEQDEPTPPSS